MADGSPKILEIGNYPPPYCGWSTRTKFLVERLRDEGVECEVLNIGPSRRVRRPECIDVQNGPDYVRKLLHFARRGYCFHVHANGDSPKGFILAILALVTGRLSGHRAVLTFHAGVRQRFFPRKSLFWKFFFRIFFGLPAAVICNSEPVRKQIASYGIPRSGIYAIPAFSREYMEVETDEDAIPERSFRFLEQHDPVLACYAYARPEFALESFFRVIERIAEERPSLGLIMIGDLDSEGPYMTYARELGLAERIHLAGTLDREAFLATLAASDVYVRTHLRDGVSSSVLEALSLGTPVVAADNETRPDSVRTYDGRSEKALLEALRKEMNQVDRDLESEGKDAPTPVPDWAEDTLGREMSVLRRMAGDPAADASLFREVA